MQFLFHLVLLFVTSMIFKAFNSGGYISSCLTHFFCWSFQAHRHLFSSAMTYIPCVDFANFLRTAFFVQKFCAKLFCNYIIGLNFFWHKIIGTNTLKKCWWNWQLFSKLSWNNKATILLLKLKNILRKRVKSFWYWHFNNIPGWKKNRAYNVWS